MEKVNKKKSKMQVMRQPSGLKRAGLKIGSRYQLPADFFRMNGSYFPKRLM
jgi:hypothetical protein